MKQLIDTNIALRILVVDSDQKAADRLTESISRLRSGIGHSIDYAVVDSIKDAYQALVSQKPNLVFIDLVDTGLRDSITFVQHTRVSHPTVVFVLYCNADKLKSKEQDIYFGWGSRLKHYFLLDKGIPEQEFDNALLFNLDRVQLDLYTYGVQESLNQAAHETGTRRLTRTQLSKIETQIAQLSRLIQAARTGLGEDDPSAPTLPTTSSPRAFVIMSFSEEFRDVYDFGIKDFLSREFGFEVFRMDECYPSGLIIHRIYEEIHNSEVVIAELTQPKPNCYYELGFADALSKPVVRLAKAGTKLPFDVNQYPFVFYTNLRDLQSRLTSALIDLGILRK